MSSAEYAVLPDDDPGTSSTDSEGTHRADAVGSNLSSSSGHPVAARTLAQQELLELQALHQQIAELKEATAGLQFGSQKKRSSTGLDSGVPAAQQQLPTEGVRAKTAAEHDAAAGGESMGRIDRKCSGVPQEHGAVEREREENAQRAPESTATRLSRHVSISYDDANRFESVAGPSITRSKLRRTFTNAVLGVTADPKLVAELTESLSIPEAEEFKVIEACCRQDNDRARATEYLTAYANQPRSFWQHTNLTESQRTPQSSPPPDEGSAKEQHELKLLMDEEADKGNELPPPWFVASSMWVAHQNIATAHFRSGSKGPDLSFNLKQLRQHARNLKNQGKLQERDIQKCISEKDEDTSTKLLTELIEKVSRGAGATPCCSRWTSSAVFTQLDNWRVFQPINIMLYTLVLVFPFLIVTEQLPKLESMDLGIDDTGIFVMVWLHAIGSGCLWLGFVRMLHSLKLVTGSRQGWVRNIANMILDEDKDEDDVTYQERLKAALSLTDIIDLIVDKWKQAAPKEKTNAAHEPSLSQEDTGTFAVSATVSITGAGWSGQEATVIENQGRELKVEYREKIYSVDASNCTTPGAQGQPSDRATPWSLLLDAYAAIKLKETGLRAFLKDKTANKPATKKKSRFKDWTDELKWDLVQHSALYKSNPAAFHNHGLKPLEQAAKLDRATRQLFSFMRAVKPDEHDTADVAQYAKENWDGLADVMRNALRDESKCDSGGSDESKWCDFAGCPRDAFRTPVEALKVYLKTSQLHMPPSHILGGRCLGDHGKPENHRNALTRLRWSSTYKVGTHVQHGAQGHTMIAVRFQF